MCMLSHLHLFCQDLERMLRFWTEALHAEFLGHRQFGGHPGAVVRSGSTLVYLKEVSGAQPTQPCALGLNHVAFAVDDVRKTADRLIQNFGCTLQNAPEGKPFLFVLGPENLLIELETKAGRFVPNVNG